MKTYLKAVDEKYFDHPLVIAKERVANYKRMKSSRRIELIRPTKRMSDQEVALIIAVILGCVCGLIYLFIGLL